MTCDALVNNGYSCAYSAATWGCDCTGCFCASTPPTPAPTFATLAPNHPTTAPTYPYWCGVNSAGVANGNAGNGFCDVASNRAECGWDGGDCCQQTCVEPAKVDYINTFHCGMGWQNNEGGSYDCQDPRYTAPPTPAPQGPAPSPSKTPTGPSFSPSYANQCYTPENGDGHCDDDGVQNTAACGWDGGDCCPQTCGKPYNSKATYPSPCYNATRLVHLCKNPLYALPPTAGPTHFPTSVSNFAMDWSTTMATSINNQANCGSCWAHSATEQLESDAIRLGLMTNSDTNKLSVQQMNSCSPTGISPMYGAWGGCSGSSQNTGWSWVASNGGITYASVYPYVSKFTNITINYISS